MLPIHPDELQSPAANDYHWSPANQRAFLEHLAVDGSVERAARHVGMSKRAAYDLRHREGGIAFALGWSAAILIARMRLCDDLLERALYGQEEHYERQPPEADGRVKIRRIRTDNRLGLQCLARLDRMAQDASSEQSLLAQLVTSNWEGFLDRIGSEGANGADIALYLAARSNDANPLAGADEDDAFDSEVAQNCGLSREEQAALDFAALSPDEAAAAMHVWFCDFDQKWLTDFPPPEDFDDYQDGAFGEYGYARALTEDEECWRADEEAERLAPLRCAAEIARRKWFGIEDGAGDGIEYKSIDGPPIKRRNIGSHEATKARRGRDRAKRSLLPENLSLLRARND